MLFLKFGRKNPFFTLYKNILHSHTLHKHTLHRHSVHRHNFTNIGYFLVNDLQQTPPPSKRANGKIFLAYVSDDFSTKIKC